jgi:subtilisin family serine protease
MWGVLDKQRVPMDFDGLTHEDDIAVAAVIGTLAINPSVQVINLSFGGGVWAEQSPPPELETALVKLFAARKNVAVVASAGNESTESKVWPAAFDNVISVGALDEKEPVVRGDPPPIAEFSNKGYWISAFANGVSVLGPFVNDDGSNGWARWSGTSFAAAIVSGRIAQVAIERGINGAEAAKAVLTESDPMPGRTAKWVRGVDSLPFAEPGSPSQTP